MQRKNKIEVVSSVAVFASALALYLSTAAPNLIYEGGVSVDSAEIQRAAYHFGIIHSTGYPIYTVLAGLVARLGEVLGQSAYSWITYFSGLCTALALLVFFRSARLIAKLLPALAVTLLLAVTNSIWWMSTIAEVQGFQALLLAGCLWALLYYHQHPTEHRALYLAALCVGVGLANHRLMVLVLPACALTLLLHYRHWRLRHLLLLAVCGLLPLLSYGYIYLRAADPFVVYSTRPAWVPQPISTQDATNIIRGTFAGGGAGLETNFELNPDALLNRLPLLYQHLRDDWNTALIVIALLALLLYFAANWRIALMLLLLALPVAPFLLIWKVDVKPIIYQYALWFPLALALATLLSLEHLPARIVDKLKPLTARLPQRINQPHVALSLGMSALVLLLAFSYLSGSFSQRNQRDDQRAAAFAQDISQLPDNALFASVQWAPDVFITLDYLERSEARFTINSTDDWWTQVYAMYDPGYEVYVGEYWRARMGLYDGATWFLEQNPLAFSGTRSEFLLQVRPIGDPRLLKRKPTSPRWSTSASTATQRSTATASNLYTAAGGSRSTGRRRQRPRILRRLRAPAALRYDVPVG
ncbi:MAG: DUF2723 domain-containing protein [Anaerolineae bacterium]